MDAEHLTELAERIATAIRALPAGAVLSYGDAIDLVRSDGVAPANAAAVMAHGIDLGLFRARPNGLAACKRA